MSQPKIMLYFDWIKLLSDGDPAMPETHKIVPLASLGYPDYTLWALPIEVIEEHLRRIS